MQFLPTFERILMNYPQILNIHLRSHTVNHSYSTPIKEGIDYVIKILGPQLKIDPW